MNVLFDIGQHCFITMRLMLHGVESVDQIGNLILIGVE